jgi:hypothetical protein
MTLVLALVADLRGAGFQDSDETRKRKRGRVKYKLFSM